MICISTRYNFLLAPTTQIFYVNTTEENSQEKILKSFHDWFFWLFIIKLPKRLKWLTRLKNYFQLAREKQWNLELELENLISINLVLSLFFVL